MPRDENANMYLNGAIEISSTMQTDPALNANWGALLNDWQTTTESIKTDIESVLGLNYPISDTYFAVEGQGAHSSTLDKVWSYNYFYCIFNTL